MTQQSEKHGGELETIAEQYRIDVNSLIDFSVNVNPLGPPASLLDAIKKGVDFLHRYPDSSSRRMCNKLANYLNLSSDNIIIGNGATELIYLISRYFKEEVSTPNVVIVAPTFSDYQRSISLVGGQVQHHLLYSETCSLREAVHEVIAERSEQREKNYHFSFALFASSEGVPMSLHRSPFGICARSLSRLSEASLILSGDLFFWDCLNRT